jgi:hypothetical protein
MRTLKNYIALLSILLFALSCEKDGDKMIVSGLEASELTAAQTDVIITQDNGDAQVLALAWSTSALTVSDPSVEIPDGFPAIYLQASSTSDFKVINQSTESSASHSYTGSELNTLAKNAGLIAGQASPLYFRIKTLMGSNQDPIYGNTVSVSVTPFQIDMSNLIVQNKDKTSNLAILRSTNSDGEYAGFMPATSWMNFYFLEGDGTYWGNDGVSGTAFAISSDVATMWNGWFPGNNGCYYVTMSTNTKEWTATYLPSITVGGDVSSSLTFDVAKNIWSGKVITTTANAKITLSSAASKYTKATGTTDASAIATTINFAESQSGVLIFANAPGNITIPAAGTYTLKVDLSNNLQWVYTVTSGTETPTVEDIPYLYLAGLDDAITGPNWNFDRTLTKQYDGTYYATVYANSLWGYKMYTKADWSSDYYAYSGTEGTLVKNVDSNIPVASAGTYIITADITNLKYNMKQLGDVVYVAGLSLDGKDNWDFAKMPTLAKTDNGIYSGTIQITAKSTWGFKIYIESGNWDYYYGGSAGSIYYKSDGITDDSTAGTYTLTVNLIQGTYSMTLN